MLSASLAQSNAPDPGIPTIPAVLRADPRAVTCSACGQWGRYVDTADDGHRIAHTLRTYPCRVPLGDPAVLAVTFR